MSEHQLIPDIEDLEESAAICESTREEADDHAGAPLPNFFD